MDPSQKPSTEVETDEVALLNSKLAKAIKKGLKQLFVRMCVFLYHKSNP